MDEQKLTKLLNEALAIANSCGHAPGWVSSCHSCRIAAVLEKAAALSHPLAEREIIERCARVCDRLWEKNDSFVYHFQSERIKQAERAAVYRTCAAAIRALRSGNEKAVPFACPDCGATDDEEAKTKCHGQDSCPMACAEPWDEAVRKVKAQMEWTPEEGNEKAVPQVPDDREAPGNPQPVTSSPASTAPILIDYNQYLDRIAAPTAASPETLEAAQALSSLRSSGLDAGGETQILHGPWSHWREPHCCGCWVITVKDGGPVASCNECSLEVDLLKILEEHTMRLSQDVAMPFSGSMERKS